MRGDVGEGRALPGDVLIIEPGGAALARINAHYFLRRAHRQWPEGQRVHDAEDGGVAADCNGEREDGDGGEPRTVAEQAGAERRVLPQFVRQPGHCSLPFHGCSFPEARVSAGGLIAELAERLCPCLGLGLSLAHEIIHAHLEVKRELLLHVVAHVDA